MLESRMKLRDKCAREGMKIGSFFRSLGAMAIITIATLVAEEAVLRVVDFRELREGVSERSLSYQYDADLGWIPVPGSMSLQPRSPALKSNYTKTCRADNADQSFAADSLAVPV